VWQFWSALGRWSGRGKNFFRQIDGKTNKIIKKKNNKTFFKSMGVRVGVATWLNVFVSTICILNLNRRIKWY